MTADHAFPEEARSEKRKGTSHRRRRNVFLVPRRLFQLLALFLLAPGLGHADPLLLHRQEERQAVTSGVDLIRIRQFDSKGWLNIVALEIDLTAPNIRLDALLGKNQLTGSQPFSKTAEEQGALAGINGDFFHIQTTSAPIGLHLQSGELFKSPPPRSGLSVGFHGGEDFAPFIGNISFSGRVTAPDGSNRKLYAWNAPAVPRHSLVSYNHRWGTTAPGPDSPDMAGWTGLVHVVLNRDQRVVDVLQGENGPVIPEGGSVLLGRGRGADWLLAHARAGQRLSASFELTPPTLSAAIGGHPLLLRDGEIMVPREFAIHPRSAVGFNRDKTRSWWVVVDGRSRLSRGVSLHDMAKIMRDFGASDALNLDGGGSSTLLARPPGSDRALVQNVSSDGRERNIPNGLGIFNTAPTGSMDKLLIQPPAPRNIHTITPAEIRLAPGANFRPVAFATDAKLNQIDPPGEINWSVTPPHLGTFSPDGVFLASQPGRGKITASLSTSEKAFTDSQPVLVIGDPVSLEITPGELALSSGQEVELKVNAVDARGYAAPLSLENINWNVRGGVGQVIGGRFVASEDPGSGAIEAIFGDLRGVAPVGIGARPVLLANFRSEQDWRTTAVPAETTSTLSFVDHLPYIRDEGPTAKLAYDFTGTTRTRAAYLHPRSDEIRLPGRPLRLGLWVFGDAREAWLRGQIADSSGTTRSIDFARKIDWTGWRYVEATIPPGTSYPISLRRLYVVETRTDAQYAGAVYFDELHAVHAPEMDPAFLSDAPPIRDPANRAEPLTKGENSFQFIVFGDSKVQADQPDSAETTVLSALLEKINEHDVEFVLFTGDLLENDSEANYRFGKSFLDRLEKPYYITVANHEIAGSDNFDRYRKFFGETYFNFTRGNSEFIVLNSARPGLRVSEEEQWPWLQERLEETTAENLFILTHIPVIDPMPGGKTGWEDAGEIAIFQQLLTEEAEKDRNVYVFHGHVHGFDRRPHDGVQYLTSAGAGSSLYLPPDRGGFFHYVVVTVKGGEVTYQVIPLLEKIALPEKVEAAVGETVTLAATGIAPDGLVRFPLTYPAAVTWKVADPQIALVDSTTGAVQTLAPGETRLTVSSGGVTASTLLTVTQ